MGPSIPCQVSWDMLPAHLSAGSIKKGTMRCPEKKLCSNVGKLNSSFAEDASLFLELLDTLLDKALDLGTHLAARRAAGRLETGMHRRRQIKAQPFHRLGRPCHSFSIHRMIMSRAALLLGADLVIRWRLGLRRCRKRLLGHKRQSRL